MSEPSTHPQLPSSLYNPSGLYSTNGVQGMDQSVANFQHPRVLNRATVPRQYRVVQEKKMVKLAPLMEKMKQERKPKMFPRFMAVP